jgi:very-short-patch-repair endonuclease
MLEIYMPNSNHKRWRASHALQERARQLRHEMTPAEKCLWQHLRERKLDGAYFRRQHAIGPFVVDFFCAKAKLVVEIDGDTHSEQIEYDTERTQWLNELKHYRVIRFTNEEVHDHIETVLERIREELQR